ncbi:hypothetical protein RSAG8_00467, partial [Rhizoctonia solani AG-8 WAC10335]
MLYVERISFWEIAHLPKSPAQAMTGTSRR